MEHNATSQSYGSLDMLSRAADMQTQQQRGLGAVSQGSGLGISNQSHQRLNHDVERYQQHGSGSVDVNARSGLSSINGDESLGDGRGIDGNRRGSAQVTHENVLPQHRGLSIGDGGKRGRNDDDHSPIHQSQQYHQRNASYDVSAISARNMEFAPHPQPISHQMHYNTHHNYGPQSSNLGYNFPPGNVYDSNHGGYGIAAQGYVAWYQQQNGVSRSGEGLGILNAETFDDGSEAIRAQREIEMRKRVQMEMGQPESTWGYVPEDVAAEGNDGRTESLGSSATLEGSGRLGAKDSFNPAEANRTSMDGSQVEERHQETSKRKKRKLKSAASPTPEDEDDAAKRVRGRPRVDPKDETPAERRRTQIRLAQRAYRNRKETTITSLEQTVQELKTSSQEVNSLFLKLFDLAASQGILGRQPDLAKRLQAASQKIKSSDDTLPEDVGEIDTEVEIPIADPVQVTPPISEPGSSFKALPQTSDEPVEEVILLNPAGVSRQHSNMQVIARPTLQNASFQFDFMEFQQYQAGLMQMNEFSHMLNMQPNPPLPTTSAFSEVSFSRRLQRQTTEAALRLAMMPNPPPSKWNRAFGITSQYETKDQIVSRLQRILDATRDQTLEQWDQPFPYIGGAGTHYPMRERDTSTMPKMRNKYGMGPFSGPVNQFKDRLVEDSLTLSNLPYHKETYFDSNDIECYLDTLGINIHPTQDFVTTTIDLSVVKKNAETETGGTKFGGRSQSLGKDFESSYRRHTGQVISQEVMGTAANPGSKNVAGGLGYAGNAAANIGTSHVTIDIAKFIAELINYCTCLGRAPGYKPMHVNQALLASITNPSSS